MLKILAKRWKMITEDQSNEIADLILKRLQELNLLDAEMNSMMRGVYRGVVANEVWSGVARCSQAYKIKVSGVSSAEDIVRVISAK